MSFSNLKNRNSYFHKILLKKVVQKISKIRKYDLKIYLKIPKIRFRTTAILKKKGSEHA